MANVTPETPRRVHVELMVPAELAIRDARIAVERLPADVGLTDAGELLWQAQQKVADYIDHQEDLKKSPGAPTLFFEATVEEREELHRLASSRSVLHWPTLLKVLRDYERLLSYADGLRSWPTKAPVAPLASPAGR